MRRTRPFASLRVTPKASKSARAEQLRTGKEVVQFAVQYLANIQGEWQPIVRFDTAHGRPHMDISHPDGSRERQELPFDNYNTALSYAIHHVKTRWQFYRERYERWKHG
ncbi:MAG: hypothetical protein WBW48_00355 [Anaerolineae bacterium]